MKELKSYTGKEANKILKSNNYGSLLMTKNSKFWQAESFDRVVRDKKDLIVKFDYVLNNPVKAGLISDWKEWQWTFCNESFVEI